MGKGGIPERWIPYSAMGRIIPGTRFFACKVPLKEVLLRNLSDHLRFGPEDLIKAWPTLGLVIDLTNTTRYYSSKDFTEKRIQYEKVFCPGKVLPPNSIIQRFFLVVDDFLARNKNNDAVIAVHCTHGVNRTGYFVCRYMIEKLNITPEVAVKSFQKARGHAIERKPYVDDLMNGCKGGSEQSYDVGQVNGSEAMNMNMSKRTRYNVPATISESNDSVPEQSHKDHRRGPDKSKKMANTPPENWRREKREMANTPPGNWRREKREMASTHPENWRREIEQSRQQRVSIRTDRTPSPVYFSEFVWTPNSSSGPHNLPAASQWKPLPFFCYSNRPSEQTPTAARMSKVFSPQGRFPQQEVSNSRTESEWLPSNRIQSREHQFAGNGKIHRSRSDSKRFRRRRGPFYHKALKGNTLS